MPHALFARPGRPLALAAVLSLATLAPFADSQPAAVESAAPRAPAVTSATAPRIDARPVERALRDLVKKVEGWGGQVGVSIVEVATGDVIAAHAEHLALNPASNAKLVTAAAALHALGAETRLLTGLYGDIDGDAVGDLVLRGQGDPSLRTADLLDMARDLASAGVRRVSSIAVDQSHFDASFTPPAFEQQPDEWAPFRAPIAAASLDGNTVTLVVRAGAKGASASFAVQPPGFADVTGAVRTGGKADPEKLTVALEHKDGRLAMRVGGQVPEGGRVMRVAKRVEDPSLLAGYALREALAAAGVSVTGKVERGGEKRRHLLVAHRSAPLADLLHELGKSSDNFYAEMIFKGLAASREHPGSAEAAAALATTYLRDIGALEEGVVVKNGSGLFDANRSTASAMTLLLRAAHRDAAIAPEFVAHLAIGGVDGTLRGRFRGWKARRAIRAKTGTLHAVATLSGYVLPPAGRQAIAFSILVNGIPGKVSAARGAMDAVVEAVAKERWAEAP